MGQIQAWDFRHIWRDSQASVGEKENDWDSAGSGSSAWYWVREKEALLRGK